MASVSVFTGFWASDSTYRQCRSLLLRHMTTEGSQQLVILWAAIENLVKKSLRVSLSPWKMFSRSPSSHLFQLVMCLYCLGLGFDTTLQRRQRGCIGTYHTICLFMVVMSSIPMVCVYVVSQVSWPIVGGQSECLPWFASASLGASSFIKMTHFC